MNVLVRQLVWTWLVGSVSTGTLAVLLTLDRGGAAFRAMSELPVITRLGVLGMLVALFAALGLLAWGMLDASWLPVTARAGALWVLVVGAGGLAGCGFAAAATFAGEFSLGAQLILAYLAGGLPFTLVAAMLARPVRVNAVALASTVVLLLIGTVIMDGRPVSMCVDLLWRLLGLTAP
jgi:hypothetical protein